MTVMKRDVKFDEDKAMRSSIKWEISIPQEEEILAPKEETQLDPQSQIFLQGKRTFQANDV